MALAEDAKDCANEIREVAFNKIHNKCPWLKSEALDAVLDKMSDDLETALIQQEDAMDASRSRMGFLKLSAELRNRIYELLLVSDTEVRVQEGFKPPTLLQTSRQIRAEAAPLYYGQNVFRFVPSHQSEFCAPASVETLIKEVKFLEAWLGSIGRRQAAMIKEMEFQLPKMPVRTLRFYELKDGNMQISGSGFGMRASTLRESVRFDPSGIPAEKWKFRGYDRNGDLDTTWQKVMGKTR